MNRAMHENRVLKSNSKNSADFIPKTWFSSGAKNVIVANKNNESISFLGGFANIV